jgi:hypothetical protein
LNERIDESVTVSAERTTRRSALLRFGALALGALGILGLGQRTAAKNSNDCNDCKQTCKQNNKKQGKKSQTNCDSKCRNKCRNN